MLKFKNQISRFHSAAAVAALTAAAAFTGGSSASAQLIYGIGGTDTGLGPNASAYTLFSFDATTPGTTTTIGTVAASTGYALESIAFQPTTGQLYGFQFNGSNNTGQLVTINRTSGVLTTLGTAFTIGSITGNSGNSASISFNPTNGAIRLDTGTFGNYRLNATTGAIIAQDQSIAYTPGDTNAGKTVQISTIAYQQSNPTTLYGIDYVNNALVTQNITAGTTNPSGQLTTVGFDGITSTQGPGSQGITIGLNGVAYLNTNVSTDTTVQDRLYTVNLTTGAAAGGALIGNSTTFNTVDVAAFVPEPSTYALCAVGAVLLGGMALRRRQTVRG